MDQQPQSGEEQQREHSSPGIARLIRVLKYDPTKRQSLTGNVLQEVFDDVNKERINKAKEDTKVLISKAIEMTRQKADIDKTYRNTSQKFEKDLGKVMNQIEAMVNGKEQPEQQPDADAT